MSWLIFQSCMLHYKGVDYPTAYWCIWVDSSRAPEPVNEHYEINEKKSSKLGRTQSVDKRS